MDTQQQIIDMVQTGINSLSAQMGVTLPHLWEAIIRQQYIQGVANIITFIFILAVWGKLFKKKEEIYRWFSKNDLEMLAVILTLSGVIISYVYFELASNGVGQIINPEYYAIQEITNMINLKQ
jgi:amino acid transporter